MFDGVPEIAERFRVVAVGHQQEIAGGAPCLGHAQGFERVPVRTVNGWRPDVSNSVQS